MRETVFGGRVQHAKNQMFGLLKTTLAEASASLAAAVREDGWRGGVGMCFEWLENAFKCLIFRMLNNNNAFMESRIICIPLQRKSSYYGRPVYRHRAHDNASPVQDAPGGILCSGRTI